MYHIRILYRYNNMYIYIYVLYALFILFMLWAHFATSFSIFDFSGRSHHQTGRNGKNVWIAQHPHVSLDSMDSTNSFQVLGGKKEMTFWEWKTSVCVFFLDIGRQEEFFDDFCLVAMVSVVLAWVDSLSVGYLASFCFFCLSTRSSAENLLQVNLFLTL